MYLEHDTFKTVVDSTCLVSIDLVITRSDGRVLLGRRVNRPAQGYWFVPGGRVFKNESLDAAFSRLTALELGTSFERTNSVFLGVYEHFYDNSVFEAKPVQVSTHYVVMAHHVNLAESVELNLPSDQHADYVWWTLDEIKDSPLVHHYTRAYLAALTQ